MATWPFVTAPEVLFFVMPQIFGCILHLNELFCRFMLYYGSGNSKSQNSQNSKKTKLFYATCYFPNSLLLYTSMSKAKNGLNVVNRTRDSRSPTDINTDNVIIYCRGISHLILALNEHSSSTFSAHCLILSKKMKMNSEFYSSDCWFGKSAVYYTFIIYI